MCLATLALDVSPRFPLVIAANRDEFMNRPTARLAWWDTPDKTSILSGRDLQAGGTWLGLTASGRLGLLTNVRDPANTDAQAPSRGEIVPLWLKGDKPIQDLWPQWAMHGYNGFNLMALDFAQGECFWLSNTLAMPKRLEKGIYGLSNAELDTPWPKLLQLKAQTKRALTTAKTVDELAMQLFDALADETPAPDAELPSTGVSLAFEKILSSAFIRTQDGSYGTRCSTLIITEKVNKRLVTHVMERTYSAGSRTALLRRVTLKNWPPRYTSTQEQLAHLDKSLRPADLRHDDRFETSDVQEEENHALASSTAHSGQAQPRRSRARSLIK